MPPGVARDDESSCSSYNPEPRYRNHAHRYLHHWECTRPRSAATATALDMLSLAHAQPRYHYWHYTAVLSAPCNLAPS